ncbi:MAG: ATP-binding protein [Acidobacteriota bacterium]
MSLKTRLRISIVTLVTLLVFAQCVVSLRIAAEANFNDAHERAQAIALQVRYFVEQRVNEQAQQVTPPPVTIEATKRLWERIVDEDLALPMLLEKTMASSNAIIEILVCDENSRALAASTPSRVHTVFEALPAFSEWKERPLWERLGEVLGGRKDYDIVVPLGVEGMSKPVLSIHVVVSTVLLRSAIMPQVRSLVVVSALSLLASIILAGIVSNVIFSSLERLSKRIESIATGEFREEKPGEAENKRESKEFADVQSKLDLLSRQFRGAREDVLQLRGNIERMLERLEESVLLFDASGRLLRASRTASRVLQGHALEQDRTLDHLFPEGTHLGDLVRRVMREGHGVRDAVTEFPRANASPLRLLANVEFLENFPDAGRNGVLLTLRDAETRKQLRTQLDVSTRLAAISRLTGGVAHEIKNPLNAIALHLEVLRSKLVEQPDVHPEVNVIGNEIARLDRVVKTFLDFQRPMELNMKPVNVVEVARQVSALLWPEAERAGVSIELDSARAAVRLRGDEDLLKQALLNVVNNGIEAMQRGGRLRVRVEKTGEEITVSVSDQGAGIPPQLQERIFNLYFTTKPKGSGIGLAMTFRIVQLHNGSIDFVTQPGEGTTFRLRFPAPDDESSTNPLEGVTMAAEQAHGSIEADKPVIPERKV